MSVEMISEQRSDPLALKSLMDQIPVPMWIFDQEHLTFLEVNQAAIARYGYTREEFLSRTVLDIRPSDDVPRFLRSELAHPHATLQAANWRHQTSRGQIIEVEITSREIVLRDHRAELVCAACPQLDGEFMSGNKIWRNFPMPRR